MERRLLLITAAIPISINQSPVWCAVPPMALDFYTSQGNLIMAQGVAATSLHRLRPSYRSWPRPFLPSILPPFLLPRQYQVTSQITTTGCSSNSKPLVLLGQRTCCFSEPSHTAQEKLSCFFIVCLFSFLCVLFSPFNPSEWKEWNLFSIMNESVSVLCANPVYLGWSCHV